MSKVSCEAAESAMGAESVIVFNAIITIGAGLVLILGILTTLFKLLQQKLGKNKDTDQYTAEIMK